MLRTTHLGLALWYIRLNWCLLLAFYINFLASVLDIALSGFESQLLCLQSNTLLMCLGRQQLVAQVLRVLPPTKESQIEFLAHVFGLAQS